MSVYPFLQNSGAEGERRHIPYFPKPCHSSIFSHATLQDPKHSGTVLYHNCGVWGMIKAAQKQSPGEEDEDVCVHAKNHKTRQGPLPNFRINNSGRARERQRSRECLCGFFTQLNLVSGKITDTL